MLKHPAKPSSKEDEMPQQDYCTIQLTKGQFAIVDAADFEMLSQWSWCAQRSSSGGPFYANRRRKVSPGKWGLMGMHRLLLGLEYGDRRCADHINMNTLDNRRSNLRIASRSQNSMNTGPRATNTSGHKGVCWDEFGKSWKAVIGVNGKAIYIGRFRVLDAAVAAYGAAAKHYHGEFARLE